MQCMQEEPTAQTCNFNYKMSLLLKQVICCYFLLSSILSTRPIIVKPFRLGHKPQIQIPNLRSLIKTLTMKFPSLSHCSTQLSILYSLLLSKHSQFSYIHINTYHDKGKYPSFIPSPLNNSLSWLLVLLN